MSLSGAMFMEAFIVALKGKDQGIIDDLRYICGLPCPIERVVNYWLLTDKDEVTVSENTFLPFRCVSLTLTRGKRLRIVVNLSLIAILREYPNYLPLNETFTREPKTGEIRPDEEWYELRNRKLEIIWDESLNSFVSSAHNLGPLSLSYAISTLGLVKFSMKLQKVKGKLAYIIHARLAFLRNELADGWLEDLCFHAAELDQYIYLKSRPPEQLIN